MRIGARTRHLADVREQRDLDRIERVDGGADVWRRHCFAWEYKGKHKDLTTAFSQLQRYAIALENPPLLVVCDMDRFEIHTNFTNTVHEVHVIPLADLNRSGNLAILKNLFSDPDRLKPGQTKTALTEQAAARFAALAQVMRDRGGESNMRTTIDIDDDVLAFAREHAKPGTSVGKVISDLGPCRTAAHGDKPVEPNGLPLMRSPRPLVRSPSTP
ncbi:type IIL restriction-modification enzyme MmeI [Burkholderia cenocepacia]|uniref:type IIL restriction-modification enzyme MmeI n=1 Tax=Burkholderia cenocepacia TaxID=95486 RepID=UPI0039EE9A0C